MLFLSLFRINKNNMKKALFFAVSLLVITGVALSQDQTESRIPLIGETAPSFKAESTKGFINFQMEAVGGFRCIHFDFLFPNILKECLLQLNSVFSSLAYGV